MYVITVALNTHYYVNALAPSAFDLSFISRTNLFKMFDINTFLFTAFENIQMDQC